MTMLERLLNEPPGALERRSADRRAEHLRRRKRALAEDEASASSRLARLRQSQDEVDVELAELDHEASDLRPTRSHRTEAPDLPDDRSSFLSGPVVQQRAAEILALGRAVRGEDAYPVTRPRGVAGEIVRVVAVARAEEPEPATFPKTQAGRIAEAVCRAAARARGEIEDQPSTLTGFAAAVVMSGRIARGEVEVPVPSSKVQRAADAIVAAARKRDAA
jgi:hypothetical protein